jgi:hypothetical protein
LRRTDYLAFILMIIINLVFLRIFYNYAYWITLAGSEVILHDMMSKVFVWGQTIISSLIFLPRYLDYMRKRQIRLELGNIDPSLFLNYHSEDVIMVSKEDKS